MALSDARPARILTLSGYNQRAVIALCRYGAATGVPIQVIARGPTDPIYLTRHADRVSHRRIEPALEIGALLDWIASPAHGNGESGGNGERSGNVRRDGDADGPGDRADGGPVVLAPSSEFFNRFALAHRAEIEAAGAILPLVERSLYEAISDKFSFARLCERHRIPVPIEFATPPSRLPYVAKPIRYAAADGRQLKPHLVLTEADRLRFAADEAASDFYYQEFVTGRSVYLLVYLPATGGALTFSQENLIQQPAGGSILLARRSDFHQTREARAYETMLRAEGFRGLVMIEVRHCERRGLPVMIEANPRMWGPIQFALDNGVDLFGALLRDFTGWAPPPPGPAPEPVDGSHYFWSGGLAGAATTAVFHGYDANQFIGDFDRIARCDLFGRADTLALHHHELSR